MGTSKKILREAQSSPLPVEPRDREWGVGVSGLTKDPSPFPRVNRLLRRLKETDSTCDTQRAVIVTECFDAYAACAQNVKWAAALREVLSRCEINIWPDELLVGELTAPPNGAPVYPEFSIEWLLDEFEHHPMENRTNDRYVISRQAIEDIKAIAPKWKGKTVSEAGLAAYTDKERQGSHLGKGVLQESLYLYAGVGHVCADYAKLLRVGFGGVKKEIEEKMAALNTAERPEDVEKQEFYKAELIMLDGVKIWIERYGRLAQTMAESERDRARRGELERIAENCRAVAEGAPQDFWQAVQLWQFAALLIIIESNGHSVTYGRFDEIFLPFYQKDSETGRFTRAFMQELTELSFLKIHQLRKIRDREAIIFSSGTFMGGTALDVGGVDRDGNDITNDLSYMALDAHAHTRIPNPWMGVRLHEGSPKEFKTKVFNVIRIGTGEPKIFNDAPIIKSLTDYGATLEDARDYVGIGCVEPAVPGKTYGWHDSGSVNLAKIFQLAINHGRCIECVGTCPYYENCAGTGGGLGPDTGSLDEFSSFDEVLVSYDTQMKYWTDMLISCINKIDYAQQRIKPLPYLSLLVEGPVEKGIDITRGGAVYNHSGPQAVGIGTVADSLSVVRRIVFDDKTVSGAELLQALRDDWEGHEPLYALVNSDRMHHYGNDDDYADDMAGFVMATYCRHIEHRPTAHGGDFKPGVYSVTTNVLHGALVSATPDGRKAGEPVSDCIGPVHTLAGSHDRNGPTAVAKSVTKLDHRRIANGIILNWKFAPTAVSGEVGRENLLALMDGYFADDGMQSQFSIVGRETMVAAQERPGDYRDLVVRIAGYSAYFTELSKELQNDLIGRTELSFD
jgi:formate C-acetyltransferase